MAIDQESPRALFQTLLSIRPKVTSDLKPNCYMSIYKTNWKENLAVDQKSLRALFQSPLHFAP